MTEPMKETANPRLIALKTLLKIFNDGAYCNLALKEALCDARIKPVDRAFISGLVYGVVKYKLHLDYVISQFSSVKLKKLSPHVLLILRMGVYQLLYLERVPVSAAVDESVKLAEKFAYRSKGFINGVLRAAARGWESIVYPEDRAQFLSVRYSYPPELVAMWSAQLGDAQCEALLKAFNVPPRLTVRTNTLKTTREELIALLQEEGICAHEGRLADCLVLDGTGVAQVSAYKDGLFTPQGVSSMLCGYVADPKEEMLVMDLCAAPGGKTTHMAQMMHNKGKIVAFDLHEHKTALILQNARRLGISIIDAWAHDATQIIAEYTQKADRVLVDAPCSGLGMMHKKPDIKWHFDAGKIQALAQLQLSILSAGAHYVKPGGELVYSTCTISRQENMDIRDAFLEQNSDFEAADITQALPEARRDETAKQGFIQLYPDADGGDGFFICKFKRKG